MSGVRDIVFIVGIALLPLCSIQHFIWPLSWCLLADVSNHTWIPECGYDELLDSYRVFIDECDMFEYNCDHETDYEAVKYSDCFKQQMCPAAKIPCPSRPTCPDHRYHKPGDKYVFFTPRRNARRNMRRNGMRKEQLKQSLPPKMFKGKRRYTPKGKRKQSTTKMMPKTIIIFKRRKITRKIPTKTNKPMPTRTKAPTTTTTKVPTRTIIQATTRTRPRSKSVKPTLTTLFSPEMARKPLTPSSTPDLVQLTLTVQEPTRTMSSTAAAPITFKTVILSKYTVWRLGKKMFRVVKGRVE